MADRAGGSRFDHDRGGAASSERAVGSLLSPGQFKTLRHRLLHAENPAPSTRPRGRLITTRAAHAGPAQYRPKQLLHRVAVVQWLSRRLRAAPPRRGRQAAESGPTTAAYVRAAFPPSARPTGPYARAIVAYRARRCPSPRRARVDRLPSAASRARQGRGPRRGRAGRRLRVDWVPRPTTCDSSGDLASGAAQVIETTALGAYLRSRCALAAPTSRRAMESRAHFTRR